MSERVAVSSWVRPVVTASVICIVAVTLCVLYIDRPVMTLVRYHSLSHRYVLLFFDVMATPSLLSLPAACCYFVFYALRRISGRPAGRYTNLLLTLSISIAVATIMKDELKWLIGRPWPGAWMQYGVYQIQPFTDSVTYGGFPSGHTTYVAAPMFVLWWRLPRYRPLWLCIVLLVMVGLVGSGHHFVGDVIAGFFLGLAAAAGTLAVGPEPAFSNRFGPEFGDPAVGGPAAGDPDYRRSAAGPAQSGGWPTSGGLPPGGPARERRR